MPHIDYLLRTKRKTISLSITQKGELVVRAPQKCSYEKICKIVEEKKNWIELHQTRIKDKLELNSELFNLESVLFLGVSYQIVPTDFVKKINFIENECYVPSSIIKRGTLKQNLTKILKEICLGIINERVNYFSTLMQLEVGEIKLSNSKRNWGSCDLHSNLTFNFRLIMLPHNIIDYVVVHELSHILEFNHSKNFWNIVQSVLPDGLNRRKILKKSDYLLQVLR